MELKQKMRYYEEMNDTEQNVKETGSKFSFKDALRRIIPHRKAQVDIYATEAKVKKPPHTEYLKTIRETGEPYVDHAMRGCTELIDWDLKIDDELKNGRHKRIDDIFPMMLLAEATGQSSPEKIGETVKTLLQQEAQSWEASANFSQEQFEESHDTFDQYNATEKKKTADAYNKTLEQLNGDTGKAYEWYAKQRDQIIEAKQEMYEQVNTTASEIQEMFSKHRSADSWSSLDNRVLVVTQPEYYQIHKAMYGSEKAKGESMFTGGFATHGNMDREGTVVVPFSTRFDLANQEDASQGIALYTITSGDTERLTHELLHLSPLRKKDASNPSEQRCDKGFVTAYFDQNGRPIEGSNQNGYPSRAMEEGSVVFFQKLKTAKTIEGTNALLNDFAETVGISDTYVEAAKITAEYAQKVGLDALLKAYTDSSRTEWLDAIENKLGTEQQQSYLQKMGELESKLNNRNAD